LVKDIVKACRKKGLETDERGPGWIGRRPDGRVDEWGSSSVDLASKSRDSAESRLTRSTGKLTPPASPRTSWASSETLSEGLGISAKVSSLGQRVSW